MRSKNIHCHSHDPHGVLTPTHGVILYCHLLFLVVLHNTFDSGSLCDRDAPSALLNSRGHLRNRGQIVLSSALAISLSLIVTFCWG